MALYAADNISKAVKNFEDRSYARVFGIVLNHRNVENENEKVETFAKEHGFDIVGEIPRSDEIYNLACPASPIHYQHDPIQISNSSCSSICIACIR